MSAPTLGLDGTEHFDLQLSEGVKPRASATLRIQHRNGESESVPLAVRIDTPIEAAYFSAGGILPYVLEPVARRGERWALPNGRKLTLQVFQERVSWPRQQN